MIKLWCIYKCKHCQIDLMASVTVYIIEKKYVLITANCAICHKDTLFAKTIHDLDEMLKTYEQNKFQPIKMESEVKDERN